MAILSKIIKELEMASTRFPIEVRTRIFRVSFLFSCVILHKDSMTEIRLALAELFKKRECRSPYLSHSGH